MNTESMSKASRASKFLPETNEDFGKAFAGLTGDLEKMIASMKKAGDKKGASQLQSMLGKYMKKA